MKTFRAELIRLESRLRLLSRNMTKKNYRNVSLSYVEVLVLLR